MMENYPSFYIEVMCTVLGIETIIGVSMNLFILIQWCVKRKHTKTRTHRNGNNFITTLKIIDLLTCVAVIPTTLVVLVLDREHNLVACFLKEGLVMFASSGSAVCVLLISLDRYSAAVLPTKPLFNPRSVRICRVSVFVAAVFGLSMPLFSLLMGAYTRGILRSVAVLPCRSVVWSFKPYYLYEAVYVVYFIITVCIVFWCYKSVLRVVRRRMEARTSINPGRISHTSVAKMRKQEIKAIRMTFAVVVTFLVCWGPHVIVTLVQFALPHSILVDMLQGACMCLAYLTPIIHPVIYTHDQKSYRGDGTGATSSIFFLFRKSSRRVTPGPATAYGNGVGGVFSVNPVQCSSKTPSC